MDGVSIVVPAYNAAKTIGECLTAARNLDYTGELEIIVVNDGSSDRTAEIASAVKGVSVIDTPRGGVARARNTGTRAAQYEIIVQLDSDAILQPNWLRQIVPLFDDPKLGAAAGYAVTGNKSLVGKLMGYDVELRLDRIDDYTNQLYTMNTAYRRHALFEVGLFSDRLRAAEDVDVSRRLVEAGYRLRLNKQARCTHYWRDDLKGYLKQQYDYAYYRPEIGRRFKKSHDDGAGLAMILQAPFTALILAVGLLGSLVSPFALLCLLLLPLMHLPETIKLLTRRKEKVILALPFLFTLRNLSWAWAGSVWSLRQVSDRLRRSPN
jgi:glycosyltransferase involved in cell wall biosynthesis